MTVLEYALLGVVFTGLPVLGYLMAPRSHPTHVCCKDDGDTPLYPPIDWDRHERELQDA